MCHLLWVLHVAHLELCAKFLLEQLLQSLGVVGIAHPGSGKDLLLQSEVQLSQLGQGLAAWWKKWQYKL